MAKVAKRIALPKRLPDGCKLEAQRTKGGAQYFAPQFAPNAEGISAAMKLNGENGAEAVVAIVNSFYASRCGADVAKAEKVGDKAAIAAASEASKSQIPFAPKVRSEAEKMQTAAIAKVKSLSPEQLAKLLSQIGA